MQFPGFKLEKLNTRITTCSKLVSVTMETIYVFDSFFLQIKKILLSFYLLLKPVIFKGCDKQKNPIHN
jgi:hypothetical protein